MNKLLEKTNDETRQTEIQLNIVADDILTGKLPCATTYEQCCSSKIWALNNIEKTIRLCLTKKRPITNKT